jgi:hypothetical protein
VVTQRYFVDDPDAPPLIKAFAEVRRRDAREGWCYQHAQAISLSIDQHAETALGNRDYFLNKPYGIGGRSDRRCALTHKPGGVMRRKQCPLCPFSD